MKMIRYWGYARCWCRSWPAETLVYSEDGIGWRPLTMDRIIEAVV